MIVPASIRRKFNEIKPDLELLRKEIQATIQLFCDKHDGFAALGRIKGLESLAEKIETGRYRKWSDLDDLVAFSIIVPSLSHEDQTLDFLRQVFVEVSTKGRSDTQKPPGTFRFEATRFIGRLRSVQPSNLAKSISSINFEVQIRTAFEHACAVATHSVYKGKTINWKTQRLAAHLKAAVEQLDLLVVTFLSTSHEIVERNWPEIKSKQHTADSFSNLVSSGKIPEELAPKDWTRFAENFYSLVVSGFQGDNRKISDHILLCLKSIEAEANSAKYIPRSISLLQFSMSILVKANMLALPLKNYVPLITQEMQEILDLKVPNDAYFLIDK